MLKVLIKPYQQDTEYTAKSCKSLMSIPSKMSFDLFVIRAVRDSYITSTHRIFINTQLWASPSVLCNNNDILLMLVM